jgi:hypothetical protein
MLKLRKAPPGVRIEAGEWMDADRAFRRSSLKSTSAQPTMKKARKQPINATTADAVRPITRMSQEEMQMPMKAREALRKSLFDAKAAAIAIDVAGEGF